jgi:hypothetical protein
MKRFILIVTVMAFLPLTNAHAQLPAGVTAGDALIASAISGTAIEQGIAWAQQASSMAMEIAQFGDMLVNLGMQTNRQLQNLMNISDVHSYKDFIEWNNRQIYLERRTEETFNDMNITIGKKNYKLTDVEGMAYGFTDLFNWDKEFTPEQREEMWVNLGMTPSNYAYIQTWQAREQKIAREFLAAREIQNEEYKKNMEQGKKNQDALEKDKNKSDDDPTKMGEKGIAVINAETNIASNKVLNDIHGDLVDIKEKMAVDMYQNRTPSEELPMSMWPEDGFKPLDK